MTQLLTVKELAEKLRCSTFQIYRLTGGRRIPFMRVAGGAIRFNPDEIDSWLAKCSVPADMGISE